MNDREEGKGIRLLRKGKRGLIQAIFSRLGLIVLLFLLQLALLLGLFSAAAEFLPHFFGGTIVFNAIIVIYLLNSEGDPDREVDVAGIFQRCAGVRCIVLFIHQE